MQGVIFQNRDHGRLHREAEPQWSPDAAGSVRLTSLFNQTKLIFERKTARGKKDAVQQLWLSNQPQGTNPLRARPPPRGLVQTLRPQVQQNGLELHLGAGWPRGSVSRPVPTARCQFLAHVT